MVACPFVYGSLAQTRFLKSSVLPALFHTGIFGNKRSGRVTPLATVLPSALEPVNTSDETPLPQCPEHSPGSFHIGTYPDSADV
jgi:hypothetical protein